MIRVLVDSSADYSIEDIKDKGLELLPLFVTIGEESFKDSIEIDRNEVYEKLQEDKVAIHTSQPSTQMFVDSFQKAKDAQDELICILVSSSLSGTYQNAMVAKDMVEYDGIYLVDSLSVCAAIQILAEQALISVAQGHSAKEVVAELEELKQRIHVFAILDELKYLAKGGRISSTVAIAGQVAKVKPIIWVTPDGRIDLFGKSLGMSRAMKAVVQEVQVAQLDAKYPVIGLYSKEDTLCNKLEQHLNGVGVTMERKSQVGAVVGTHIGTDACGLVYVTEE